MTIGTAVKNKKSSLLRSSLELFAVLSVIVVSFIFAKEIKNGVLFGMRFGALEVISAVFPFFILADYMYSHQVLSCSFLKKPFTRLFGLSERFLRTFILASLFGFPIGAKCCAEEYKLGASEDEIKTAVYISSNPSLAFCVFAVGMGCLSSLALGFLLYCSMLSATAFAGLIFKRNHYKSENPSEISRQSFDLSFSIRSAGFSSLSVCSFITFFSAVISLVECFIKSPLICAFLSCFFEIGNASARASILPIKMIEKIPLLGFGLGFSGLSVILQAKAALPPQIKLKGFTLFKLIEGCVCALISLALFSLFSKIGSLLA